MQTITVKSVQEKHSKDGSKTFYVVTDSKGADMSTFEVEAMALQPGTVIEADVEINGKYTNLKGFKVVSNPSIAKPAQEPPFQKVDNSASIEKQVAIKEVGECWRIGKLKDDDILVTAYRAWLTGRLMPPTSAPSAQATQQAKATPVTTLPASQKEVFDKIMALVKSNSMTTVDATKTVVNLGGAGDNIIDKIKSLKPEKLQELNKKLDGLTSPFPEDVQDLPF